MTRASSTILALLLACTLSACDEQPDSPPAAGPAAKRPEVLYAVRFAAGPAAKPGVPLHQHPGIEEHIENMQRWKATGVLAFGGPYTDGAGGMAVLRTKSLAEAETLAKADPAVTAGWLKPEVHPWLLVFAPEAEPAAPTPPGPAPGTPSTPPPPR